MTPAPAQPGDPVSAIDTPALVVDLDAFAFNLDRMARFGRESRLRIRPHAKTHRCPEVARRQVAAGAVGLCVQSVGEAEAMVAGGIRDVLVTNQVLAPAKLARLAALAGKARIGLLADSPEGVDAAARAAAQAGCRLDMLVEIEVGMGRCGIRPGDDAAALARRIADSASLRFGGLQAYHGRAQHIRDHAGRAAAVAAAAGSVRETLVSLDRQGLAAEIIGGAGTGTFRFEAASGIWNELQVGSYCFLDREYAELEDERGRVGSEFRNALFLLASVISRPGPDRAVANAGLKVLTLEQGRPTVFGRPGLEVTRVSDEHALIESRDGEAPVLGERVRLVPGHCDPTVNLHDWIVGVRGDQVEEVWPVSARGASR